MSYLLDGIRTEMTFHLTPAYDYVHHATCPCGWVSDKWVSSKRTACEDLKAIMRWHFTHCPQAKPQSAARWPFTLARKLDMIGDP